MNRSTLPRASPFPLHFLTGAINFYTIFLAAMMDTLYITVKQIMEALSDLLRHRVLRVEAILILLFSQF